MGDIFINYGCAFSGKKQHILKQNIREQLKTPGEKPSAFKKEKIRRKH